MEDLNTYLEKIDIKTKVLEDRVGFMHDLASKICPEEIEGIFISDYIEQDNTRAYESIWFFSKGYCLEAHNFETEHNIDIVPTSNVYRLVIRLKDYDFKNATQKSRMEVQIHFREQISGNLKAAKENCDVLRDIVLTYIKPNY